MLIVCDVPFPNLTIQTLHRLFFFIGIKNTPTIKATPNLTEQIFSCVICSDLNDVIHFYFVWISRTFAFDGFSSSPITA